MNVVDLISIAPFYISLLLEGLEDFKIIGKAGKIIRLVRVMRFLRIFKLVRHFAGLQALLYTLQQAYRELGMLILLVAVALTTFARYYIGVEWSKCHSSHVATSVARNAQHVTCKS